MYFVHIFVMKLLCQSSRINTNHLCDIHRSPLGSSRSRKWKVDFLSLASGVQDLTKDCVQNPNHRITLDRKCTPLKRVKRLSILVLRKSTWVSDTSASIAPRPSLQSQIGSAIHLFTQESTVTRVKCAVKDTTETISLTNITNHIFRFYRYHATCNKFAVRDSRQMRSCAK